MDFSEFLQCGGKEIVILRNAQASARNALLERMFKLADVNGSGTLSKEEIAKLVAPMKVPEGTEGQELTLGGK